MTMRSSPGGRFCAMLVLMGSATAAWADVPRLVAYQGRLTNASGQPLPGPVNLVIKVYDAATAGNVLFTETQNGVTLANGIFAVAIGGQTSGGVPDTAFNATQVWLGISVDGAAELTPRTRIGMVAFAAKSRSAEQLVKPGTFQAALTVDSGANIGINTTPNSAKLDVQSGTNGDGIAGRCAVGGRSGVAGFSSNTTGYGGYFENLTTTGIALWVQGRARMSVAEITGGSDLAEPFAVRSEGTAVKAGMVTTIAEEHAGRLKLATKPYDRAVAGIISGANDLSPGMVMKGLSRHAEQEHPVALSGRVWCWCDADFGAITPGDLLTSSATAGHAMRIGERHDVPRGCIVGKAMSSLKSGRGLVLVLVQPQ